MTFHVGLTRDMIKADGSPAFPDMTMASLDRAAGVEWDYLRDDEAEISPAQIAGKDALVVLAPRITAATLAGEGADRLAIIARIGVGYDSVDVDACTRAGVALVITPDGVRRPVASSVLALVLALSYRLMTKDRLTRSGRWAERADFMGIGLTGRTLGLIGLGNIGCEVFRLFRPLDMRYMACDPFAASQTAAELGVELVDLRTLLTAADFVCVCCALTSDTHHLIAADELAAMKETAFLINVARGPIVDQGALTAALQSGQIQGAAIDVYEEEPVDAADPLLQLENVIVTPHAISWTDEAFRMMSESACRGILEVAAGRPPQHVVNGEVLEQPRFVERLRQYAGVQRG